MADRVRKVNYCSAKVISRAGQGAKLLAALREAGINLFAFTGFPDKDGKAQLDFVADKLGPIRRVAAKNGWRLSKPKRAFLIQGKDAVGSCHRHIQKLADQKINITAADGLAAGKGRYGMILWVKPKDYTRAARVLKAK
jgi:hypothetical protein